MNTEWKNLIIEIAESYGWSAKFEDNPTEGHELCFIFSQYSPEGQDCNIELYIAKAEYEAVCESLYQRYTNFDVSYETYIWLDKFGHGGNGAPYDMKDVYEDMQWFKDEMEILCDALKNKKKAEKSSADEEKYDIAFKVVYGADGLTKDDFVELFHVLSDTEAYPIEIMAKERECSAICLVTAAGFEGLGFDYNASGFKDYMTTVLDERMYENNNIFTFKDIKIAYI